MEKFAVLIDNDAEDLELLEKAIKDAAPDMVCMSFIFADEAVWFTENVQSLRPEYIFVDVNMSRITGAECLQSFRSNPRLKETKIILYSGVMPRAVGEAFKKSGAHDFFQKPTRDADYKELMTEILALRPSLFE